MVEDSTKALLGENLDVVKKSLKAKLKDSIGHDFQFFQDMDDLFVADNVFTGYGHLGGTCTPIGNRKCLIFLNN